jgi:transcriptional regulator with XRE-family HTH domain
LKYKTGEKFRRIADELYDGVIGDLARALKMKPESFSKYTSGRTHPGWKLLTRLLNIGVNINWFLCDIPPMLIKDIPTTNLNNGNDSSIQESDITYDKQRFLSDTLPHHLEDGQWQEVEQFIRFLQSMNVNDQTKRRLLESFVADILAINRLD